MPQLMEKKYTCSATMRAFSRHMHRSNENKKCDRFGWKWKMMKMKNHSLQFSYCEELLWLQMKKWMKKSSNLCSVFLVNKEDHWGYCRQPFHWCRDVTSLQEEVENSQWYQCSCQQSSMAKCLYGQKDLHIINICI